MSRTIREDVDVAIDRLGTIHHFWDGRKCILELKEAEYNWRQMEWIGWYFEWLCRQRLNSCFVMPGDRFGNVTFDTKGAINWDFKAKAIKTDSHVAILNDCEATERAIEQDGAYGIIVALLDVEYNDDKRTFQRWHTQLKGGLSRYEKERKSRTSVSRYRKTSATLQEILFAVIRRVDEEFIITHKQGRNSDGSPRRPKYAIDMEKMDCAIVDKLVFDGS